MYAYTCMSINAHIRIRIYIVIYTYIHIRFIMKIVTIKNRIYLQTSNIFEDI